MLACTAWPGSTSRLTTTPSIGRVDLRVRHVQLGLVEVRLSREQLLLRRIERRLTLLDRQLGRVRAAAGSTRPLSKSCLVRSCLPDRVLELHFLNGDLALLPLDVGVLQIDLHLQQRAGRSWRSTGPSSRSS